MSIETDARQEAERRADQRFPELVLAPENEQRADDFTDGFEAGAVWAREQDTREPSEAEVEHVARAIQAVHNPKDAEVPAWEDESKEWRETYRDFSRAALRAAVLAAQGVGRG